MTCAKEMQRLASWKNLSCCNDHLSKNIISLRLHEFRRASQSVDRKVPLRHLGRGPFNFAKMDPSLYWTHPKDIPTGHRCQGLIRPPHGLVHGPSCTARIASEASGDVENYANVSVDSFLVSDDFVRFYSHLAIFKDLISTRICSNTLVKANYRM